ncbi:MAG: 1,4-alpha-glucan branching enzyme, partial [Comamonadaceae bacterium]
MISDRDVQALVGACHPDPFAVLGMHADAAGRLWLRAMLPGAQVVQVLDARTQKTLATLALRHPAGLFEAVLPRRRKRFDYCLRVDWGDVPQGAGDVCADAYAFGPQLSDEQLLLLCSGEHPEPYTVMGAHPVQQQGVAGVRFAVWAPNARRVSVVGSFNNWDGRRHPMRLRHL